MTSTHAALAGVSAEALTAFLGSIRGGVLQAGDAAFDGARGVWNGMVDRRPALIARCLGPADVISAVNFARDNNLSISVRSGGHNVAGTAVCDGGMMIDLSLMRGVRVDAPTKTVRVQGGALWADVDRETQVFGLATPSGYVSATGVGGFTLGGGYGHLRRKHGLTIDNLVSADVVTADGQLRVASATENSDLFWALRGGGGNFGVVTSFEFKCHPVGPMIWLCAPFYPLSQGPQVVKGWRDFLASAPEDISSNIVFWSVPAVPMFPPALQNQHCVGMACLYPGDPAAGEKLTAPLRALGTPLFDLSSAMPYFIAQGAFDPFFPSRSMRYYWKATDLPELSDQAIDKLCALAAERPTHQTIMPLWHFGGAQNRVDPTATAFSRRSTKYMISFDGCWTDPADDQRCRTWVRDAITAVAPFSDGGHYVNFPGLAEDGEAQARAGYGVNYDRLVAIKRTYDPKNLFRHNVNIKP